MQPCNKGSHAGMIATPNSQILNHFRFAFTCSRCRRWERKQTSSLWKISLKQHRISDITQGRHVLATFCQFSASTLALRALGCGNHLLFHTCRRVNRPAQNHGNWQECEKEKSQSPGRWASLLRLKQGWCPGWGKRGWESGGSSNPESETQSPFPPAGPCLDPCLLGVASGKAQCPGVSCSGTWPAGWFGCCSWLF